MSRTVPLFGLQLRHAYAADGLCRDLDIVPTAATLRLLDRHRLRLLPRTGGVTVAALTDADGSRPLIAPPLGEVFAFDLKLVDPAFACYTDLQALAALADPVYRNTDTTGSAGDAALRPAERECWASETLPAAAQAGRVKWVLAGSPLAADGDPARRPRAADLQLLAPAGKARISTYDAASRSVTLTSVAAGQTPALRYRCRPTRRADRLAAVELRYDPALAAAGRAGRPAEIRFEARAARWAYYLLTDQAGDFSIVDAAPSGLPLGFSAGNRTQLGPAHDDTDAVAQALGRQHAALRRLRFLSDQPVPCSSTVRRGLELRLDQHKVIEALPNPAPQQLGRILGQAAAPPAGQDTFHQVLRYLRAI